MTAELRLAGCVFAEEEARMLIAEAATADELDRMVRQRAGGLPLEQVLGWAQFCGLRIAVDPAVFVPRRRTELLAREAARLAAQVSQHAPLVVVDLCCGTGALGAAVAAGVRRTLDLHAADIDPAAVECTRRNLAPLGGQVYQGDLYSALPEALRGKINVLIANVPYVPTDDLALLPAEARDHEPRVALDGGSDGLEVMRAVAGQAPRWLAVGGHLLVEASERQLPAAMQVIVDSGLLPRVVLDDEMDAAVIVATRAEVTEVTEQAGNRADDPFGGRQPTSHERMTGLPWDASYRNGPAPWDIGRPQPVVVRLAAEGAFVGPVLDAGCGTGENALHIAALGVPVLGFDVAETALSAAREKAAERGIAAEFVAADAFALDGLGRTFATVLDCGLFHTFRGDERARYVAALTSVTERDATLHLLCFSDEGPDTGPHPVSRRELEAAFGPGTGWAVAAIEPDRVETRFQPSGAPAWLAMIKRI